MVLVPPPRTTPTVAKVIKGESLRVSECPGVGHACEFVTWFRSTFFSSLSVYINVGAHMCGDQRTTSGVPVSHRNPFPACAATAAFLLLLCVGSRD